MNLSPRVSRNRLYRGAALLLAATALAGCVPYQLGTSLPPDLSSIFVRTFVNGAKEARLEFETTTAAIAEFQRDATLRIGSEGNTDSILETKLIGYVLTPVRYSADKRTQATEYRLTVTADAVLKDGAGQKILLTLQGIKGETTFIVSSDLKTDERRALPAAAKDLAHNIVKNVVEYW